MRCPSAMLHPVLVERFETWGGYNSLPSTSHAIILIHCNGFMMYPHPSVSRRLLFGSPCPRILLLPAEMDTPKKSHAPFSPPEHILNSPSELSPWSTNSHCNHYPRFPSRSMFDLLATTPPPNRKVCISSKPNRDGRSMSPWGGDADPKRQLGAIKGKKFWVDVVRKSLGGNSGSSSRPRSRALLLLRLDRGFSRCPGY